MSLWCTVRVNVIGVACWLHSSNRRSVRTIVLTLAAATSNDHNKNNNNNYDDDDDSDNIKTKVIPVVTGATGTISKLFRKYLRKILGKHKARNYRNQPHWMQTGWMNQNNIAIWGTAHIVWKVVT